MYLSHLVLHDFRNFKQLGQALAQTRKLGLRYIELYSGHLPLNSTEAQIKAARNLCRENNITPIAFGAGFSR